MKCEEMLRMLNDYVDQDIDPAVCDQFQEHLDGCNPRQVVVDTIRKTITLYKEGEAYNMPVEFRDRLHQTLRERWSQKSEENH